MHYPIVAIFVGGLAMYCAATFAAGKIARTGFPITDESRRIGCVDGLRGYLALSVLVHHGIIWMQVTSLGGTWSMPTVNLFSELGAASVALFFMVTGLVFYPRVKAGLRRTSWPAIYVTRFFRIVPLVFASVLLITVIIALRTGRGLDAGYPGALIQWTAAWGEPPLLGYADSGQVNAHVLWSLGYEWIFYLLILPACALASDLLRGRMPAAAVPIGLLLLCFGVRMLDWFVPLLNFLPLFALGMLAHECQSHQGVRELLTSRRSTIMAIAALVTAVTIRPLPYSWLILPLLGFFFCCVACGNSIGGLLKTRGALLLGEVSFGIYLFHGIVLYILYPTASHVLDRATPGELFLLLLPVAGALVVGLAALLHVGIERLAIRLGARIAKLWTGRGSVLGSPALQVAP